MADEFREIFQELDLMQTVDAHKWAAEFMRIFGERRQDIDEGLMVTWFASAIMCGMDEQRRRNSPLRNLTEMPDGPSETDQSP